jgi:Flp pilus assembly secretin CpaC
MADLLQEIEAEITGANNIVAKQNVGTVREIGDGVAKIEGLTRAKLNEMLDFGNGITLSGFRIPALSVRRAETDVELRDGQSFVIAGLLDNLTQENGAAIPLLSRLPIIGNLFKSKSESAERTELMVLITPRLVQPLDPDEVPTLPTRPRRFLPPPTGDVGNELEGGGTVDAPSKPTDPKAKPTDPKKAPKEPR